MAYMTSFVPADLLEDHEETHPPSTSPNYVFSSCPPQDFHGVSPLLMRRSMSFSGVERYHEQGGLQGDDDMSDDGSQFLLGEKKKRLNMEQVRALEKSFELGNKLEPERKTQLARALGLQPRQIAIWFQNRRARWKTKQLEKDYDLLKRQFEALKADNDSLRTHNKKLLAELMVLKGRESTTGSGVVINLNKETKGVWSNGNEKSCDVSIGGTRTAATDSPLYSNPSNRHIMPSPVEPASSSSVAQFLLHSQKIDQMVPDESLSNMFINGIEDRPGFWAWSEQQQFR